MSVNARLEFGLLQLELLFDALVMLGLLPDKLLSLHHLDLVDLFGFHGQG